MLPWRKTAEVNGNETSTGRAADADEQSVDEWDIEVRVACPEDRGSNDRDDQTARGSSVISMNITGIERARAYNASMWRR